MGAVTGSAPLCLDRGMLKNPGTPFIGVAFKADVVIKFIPLSQAGPCPGSVRRVTVSAFYGAL
jgi:hypothetical protein